MADRGPERKRGNLNFKEFWNRLTAGGAAGEKPQRRKKREPRYTGKARVLYYCYITLTVLAGLIVTGYVLFSFLSAPPPVNPPEVTRPPQPVLGGDDGPDIIQPSMDRKDQFYTFLLVGQSQETGGNLTDTMMLAAYDVPNQTLSVMSLPRDTYVELNGRNVLLNTVYTRSGSGDRGIKALKQEVGELTGVYPDYYVVIKWEAFGELVDAIGGVWYDVPRDMYYWDPTQDLLIDVKKGPQLLDGDKAMQVVRFREGRNGYVDGDLGRIRTQQGFMKALVNKCLDPSVLLSNLTEYIAIFQRNVTTDLDLNALTYFAKSAVGGLDMDDVSFVTLPIREAGDGAHLLADRDGIVTAVNNGFNPYVEDIGAWELDVVTSIPLPTRRPEPSVEPSESMDPEVSPDPETSPDPEESPDPAGSPEPLENGDEPLIPDTTNTPAPTESEIPKLSPPPVESEEPPILIPPVVETTMPVESDDPPEYTLPVVVETYLPATTEEPPLLPH